MNIDNHSAFTSTEYDKKIRNTIPYYEEFYKQVVELVTVFQLDKLSWLDVGCGTGKMAEVALANFNIERFVCCDVSKEMLEIAKKRFDVAKAEFKICNALEMQYQEEFDVVTAIQVNHYFHKDEKIKALKKYYAALKSGGIYIGFENFAPYSEYARRLCLEKWKAYQLRQGKDSQECEEHICRYGVAYFPITLTEHLQILQAAGFQVAEILWVSNMQAGVFGIKI